MSWGTSTRAAAPGEREPAQAAAPGLAGLDGTGDQRLAGGAPAALAGSRPTDVGLVGLDPAGQGLAIRADHGLAELVQPAPGGLVAAETELPLQLGGGDPALARGHQVDGEEPARQGGLGLLEEGAGEHGVLLAAGHALVDEPGPQRVGVIMTAAVAAEPSGQRARNRYSRHCSSVPNRALNSRKSCGRSSGSMHPSAGWSASPL